jgi:hypothetical protein
MEFSMTDFEIDLGSPAIIAALWNFKAEKAAPAAASTDHVLMHAGRDNIHGSLKAAIGATRSSLVFNMYGMDDPELWAIVWNLIEHPGILVQITLDKSQAGGPTEKRILDDTRGRNLADFNSHIAIGQSATHQISHTKGGVIDGVLAWHGSVNWSASGEGTFVQDTGPGGVGYKSQNNTLSWFTDQPNVNGFRDELAREHAAAVAQAAKSASAKSPAA